MRVYMKKNAKNILAREPFKADSISGRTVLGPSYVIRSYSTPIALYYKGQWYLTNEKFSQTTSTQQSALRLILNEVGYLEVDWDVFANYWHKANNAK